MSVNAVTSFLGVKGGRRVTLTTSPPSVSRLSRKYGILDFSRPPKPVTGITLVADKESVLNSTLYFVVFVVEKLFEIIYRW
jgi:hypothetical protein